MLPFDYPPPRRSKRLFARWLGYSTILHAVLAACMLAGAYALPRYLPVQSGGAVMVSLAGAGRSLAGEVGQQAQAASGMAEDVPAMQPMTETATKAEQKVAEVAVPVKKHSVKPKQAERLTGNHKAQPLQHRQEQSAQPKPQQVTTAAGQSAQTSLPAQSGGDGGQSSASSGSSSMEQATGVLQGEGSPHPQVVPWNAQGGPRFLRQAPLRYPRAAQRRNLEGKAVVEHPRAAYALWKEAGAVRFLLKHETADPLLYEALHPGHVLAERIASLRILQRLGYEIGSGFMVGLPGQSLNSLADDIILARRLGVSMCGAGPFIPQHDTPLGAYPAGNAQLALRVMAVMRIVMPWANIPATTALATVDAQGGQRNGLLAGGNVLMPSFTPSAYGSQYCIYDNKNRVDMLGARKAIEGAGRSHTLACWQEPAAQDVVSGLLPCAASGAPHASA